MVSQPEQGIATSVLVIGSGGAGLRAGIELAEIGVDVIVVGRRTKTDAHTSLAAGGINAALGTMDPEDSWQQHAADTLTESYLLADPTTVQIVTQRAASTLVSEAARGEGRPQHPARRAPVIGKAPRSCL